MKFISQKLVLIISSITIASLFSGIASADWGIGLSGSTVQSEYKHKGKSDSDVGLIVNLHPEYRGERLNLNREGATYNIIKADKYALEVVGKANIRGYKAKDLEVLKGMKERKGSLDAGVRLTAKMPYLPISLSATTDISRSHKGQEVGLKVGGIQPSSTYWTGKRNVSIAAVSGLDWKSKKVVDYYYGVKESEVTADRKAYKGKAAFTPYLGFETEAKLSRHLSITGGATYKHLPKEIRNSPLTRDKKSNYQMNLGVSYWF
ncbi:MAG: MipA/OmpV family protein [Cocleimonas sp.]|nr:MipA/OmpV family protein [Cocleimonas sp.]